MGGKRASTGRLGKDRSPRHSRHTIARAEYASSPITVVPSSAGSWPDGPAPTRHYDLNLPEAGRCNKVRRREGFRETASMKQACAALPATSDDVGRRCQPTHAHHGSLPPTIHTASRHMLPTTQPTSSARGLANSIQALLPGRFGRSADLFPVIELWAQKLPSSPSKLKRP